MRPWRGSCSCHGPSLSPCPYESAQPIGHILEAFPIHLLFLPFDHDSYSFFSKCLPCSLCPPSTLVHLHLFLQFSPQTSLPPSSGGLPWSCLQAGFPQTRNSAVPSLLCCIAIALSSCGRGLLPHRQKSLSPLNSPSTPTEGLDRDGPFYSILCFWLGRGLFPPS